MLGAMLLQMRLPARRQLRVFAGHQGGLAAFAQIRQSSRSILLMFSYKAMTYIANTLLAQRFCGDCSIHVEQSK